MEHLFFGTDRRLFATVERPKRLQPRSAAVLLCNPFGEEAVRAHRIYRVLAEHLCRSGYTVMRFDFSGTGDSEGEVTDATIEAWLDDIDVAAAELTLTSRSRRLVVFGLRLGAALAALAAARARQRVRHLVLWDPVVSGPAYLGELAEAHRAYLRSELGAGWPDRLEVTPEGYPKEALGSAIPDALRAGMARIDLLRLEPRADNLTVVSTRSGADIAQLQARLSGAPHARWITASVPVSWNSDEGLNAAVVPMEVVRAVVERVEEVSP